MTEIALIQVFCLTVGSKQKKDKNAEYRKNGIPWHLHTLEKLALLKTRDKYNKDYFDIGFLCSKPCLDGKSSPIMYFFILSAT